MGEGKLSLEWTARELGFGGGGRDLVETEVKMLTTGGSGWAWR